MNCVNHPQTPAAAYCRTCGKALCANCTRPVRGVIYCEDCLANRVEGLPAAAAQAQPGGPVIVVDSRGPNPAVAGILSAFLPLGTGAMYCGEFTRALVHAAVFIAICSISSTVHSPADGILGGIGVFWYIFMIVDSVRVARAKQRGEPVPDLLGFGLGHPTEPNAASAVSQQAPAAGGEPLPSDGFVQPRHVPLGPILLIGLGLLFMLNVWDIWIFSWDRTWPLIVIGVGVWMLFSRIGGWSMHYGDGRGMRMNTLYCSAPRLIGPAMVITTGVLGLLDEYSNLGWGRTWPLYLVVLGAVKMLQMMAPPPPPPPSAPPAGGTPTSSPEPEVEVHNG